MFSLITTSKTSSPVTVDTIDASQTDDAHGPVAKYFAAMNSYANNYKKGSKKMMIDEEPNTL